LPKGAAKAEKGAAKAEKGAAKAEKSAKNRRSLLTIAENGAILPTNARSRNQ
jgi:hypothetical protein